MLYCEKCMLLSCEKKCHCCGEQDLRVPNENAPVYLLTKEAIWFGGIENTLKENNIFCLKQSISADVLTIDMRVITEAYRFFVPYGAYEKAKELLNDYF